MDYRTPPGTDLHLPRLVLGTMTFGSQVDRDAAATMVEQSRDAGITMFDTANSYNAGASEQLLGELVAPFRADVLIASKVFNPTGDGSGYRGLRRPAIEEALEATLRRLGTDYLDLYYLHAPDWDTPIEETLGAMADAVTAGKVRQVGVSNYAAWQIAEIRCLSGRNGWPTMSVSQPMYNLLARRVEDEYAACSARYGVHNVVYNPLAGGLLSGKHTDLQSPQERGRFGADLGPMYRARYWNDQQFAAVSALRAIADDAGMTLLELSFRWLLGRPLVGSVLLGASSPDQLSANLAAASGPSLSSDVQQACDEVWMTLRGAAPLYNR
jgi:aryl-alcohol dehydrogenase-like predicted oxidoreductase